MVSGQAQQAKRQLNQPDVLLGIDLEKTTMIPAEPVGVSLDGELLGEFGGPGGSARAASGFFLLQHHQIG